MATESDETGILDGNTHLHESYTLAPTESGDTVSPTEAVEGSKDPPMGEGGEVNYIQATLDVEQLEKMHREQGIIKEEVLNHIMFHKALIDDDRDNDYSKYDRYIQMINDLHTGYHLSIDDPFDKSIAITFELVMENMLDPWDIDLMSFTGKYLSHVDGEEDINLLMC